MRQCDEDVGAETGIMTPDAGFPRLEGGRRWID
jgi:hypothetical protein